MAYVYQVTFDIQPDQMGELQIGASLERVLGYLRSLLPSESGYVTARAMYSVDVPETTHLVIESIWQTWHDLEAHSHSELAEAKVVAEFDPHITPAQLGVHIYEEVP